MAHKINVLIRLAACAGAALFFWGFFFAASAGEPPVLTVNVQLAGAPPTSEGDLWIDFWLTSEDGQHRIAHKKDVVSVAGKIRPIRFDFYPPEFAGMFPKGPWAARAYVSFLDQNGTKYVALANQPVPLNSRRFDLSLPLKPAH